MASKGRVIKSMSNLTESSYRHMIARGEVADAHTEVAYGELTSTAAATHHILHPTALGPDLNIIDPAGVQITLVSTSAEDGAGTLTGILQVDIHYLDSNLDERREEVTLNGTTAVTTVADDIRHIQCIHGIDFGSTGAAVGNITLSNGGTDYAVIVANDRRCTSSVRRVPRGKKLVITDVWGGSTSGTGQVESTIRLGGTFINEHHDLTETGNFFPFMGIATQNAAQALHTGTPLIIPEARIVAMEVDVGATGCNVVAGYAGYYEPA